MDILLTFIGILCIILGLIGSFLPILPGPPISWVGLLLLHLTDAVPDNNTLLIITFIVAVLVFTLDYIIPAIGTKRFGGSKAGVIGTSIGLIIGLIAPIPFGIIIGPFVGTLIGELSHKADIKTAIRAAFGSFLGFVTSTLLKFIVTCIYFGIFVNVLWDYKNVIF